MSKRTASDISFPEVGVLKWGAKAVCIGWKCDTCYKDLTYSKWVSWMKGKKYMNWCHDCWIEWYDQMNTMQQSSSSSNPQEDTEMQE